MRAYVLANIIPFIDFVMLLFVIVRLQMVNFRFETRTRRFERLEQELSELRSKTESVDHQLSDISRVSQ